MTENFFEFGAQGTTASNARANDTTGIGDDEHGHDEVVEVVPYNQYNMVAAQIEGALDDRHLDDTHYEESLSFYMLSDIHCCHQTDKSNEVFAMFKVKVSPLRMSIKRSLSHCFDLVEFI